MRLTPEQTKILRRSAMPRAVATNRRLALALVKKGVAEIAGRNDATYIFITEAGRRTLSAKDDL